MINSLGGGGAERQFLEVANRLDREAFDVSVALMADGGVMLDCLDRDRLVSYTALERPSPGGALRLRRPLQQLYATLTPDIVHSWLPYSNALAAASRYRSQGFRLVTAFRSAMNQFSYFPLFSYRRIFGRFIVRRTVARSDVVLLNSRSAMAELEHDRVPGSKLRYIPNGIDCRGAGEAITQPVQSAESRDALQPFRFIAVGRLSFEKNYFFILSAFQRLLERFPNATLDIVGDGVQREEITARVAAMGLDKHILIRGFQHNVPARLRAADAFVMASRFEGMPNAVMEAMAAGTPIVATAVGGVPDLVEHGVHGRIVPAEDPGQFADALHAVIAEPARSRDMARMAWSRIREFDFAQVIPKYEALYASLL